MNQNPPFNRSNPTAAFLAENPDLDYVEIVVSDVNGVQRGKWISPNHLDSVFKSGFKFPADIVTADIWGRDVPEVIEGTGEGDCPAAPIPSTLRLLTWEKRPAAQVRLGLRQDDGTAWPLDPRGVLETIQAKFHALGLTPVVAAELEFALYDQGAYPVVSERIPEVEGFGLGDLDALREHQDLIAEISTAASEAEIPLDGILKELGPFQYEVVMSHQRDALLLADNATFLKSAIKGIARKHKKVASFMAKPDMAQPGNGLHLHLSLLDRDGNNIFDDGGEDGTKELSYAVGGLLDTLQDMFLVFAPHLNSFRRFGSGTHAALAATWGYENRGVAIRIPGGSPKARRVEHRIAGADTNIYLVLAAVLAGVLHGLENRITPPAETLPEDEPPEQTLPGNWHEALSVFEESGKSAALFTTEFRDVFAAVKRFEIQTFDTTISRFERDSYFDIV